MSEREPKKYTRGQFIKGAAVTTIAAGAGGGALGYYLGRKSAETGSSKEDEVGKYLPLGFTPRPLFTRTPEPEVIEEVTRMPTQIPTPTEPPATSEPMSRRQFIEWGVRTSVNVEPAPQENLTMEAFKEDVARMKELGADWVRFNVWEWEVQYADRYKEAIDYAKETGLNVFLVTNVPGLSENGEDFEGDLTKTRAYYENLSRTFGDKVDIWQIFNEPDDHDYADYSELEGYPDGYLETFSAIVAEANRTIKGFNPYAKTTVNVSMWVGADWGTTAEVIGEEISEDKLDEEISLFNAACGVLGEMQSDCTNVDYITLDFYPDKNEIAISQLPDIISFFNDYYGSDVIVGELGLPTGDGRFSEEDQGEYVAKAIESLQRGATLPHSVILYEWRDEAMKAGTEASFGITDTEGNSKQGFMRIIRPLNEPRNE